MVDVTRPDWRGALERHLADGAAASGRLVVQSCAADSVSEAECFRRVHEALNDAMRDEAAGVAVNLVDATPELLELFRRGPRMPECVENVCVNLAGTHSRPLFTPTTIPETMDTLCVEAHEMFGGVRLGLVAHRTRSFSFASRSGGERAAMSRAGGQARLPNHSIAPPAVPDDWHAALHPDSLEHLCIALGPLAELELRASDLYAFRRLRELFVKAVLVTPFARDDRPDVLARLERCHVPWTMAAMLSSCPAMTHAYVGVLDMAEPETTPSVLVNALSLNTLRQIVFGLDHLVAFEAIDTNDSTFGKVVDALSACFFTRQRDGVFQFVIRMVDPTDRTPRSVTHCTSMATTTVRSRDRALHTVTLHPSTWGGDFEWESASTKWSVPSPSLHLAKFTRVM